MGMIGAIIRNDRELRLNRFGHGQPFEGRT
jgi:hypothetical protein